MTLFSLLPLFISLRFINGRKGSIISFISITSIISISLGIAVLLISLSIMNGFEYELNHRILSIIPHGEIESVNQPWKNWNYALHKIKKLNDVIAAAPYISFNSIIKKNNNIFLIQIKGINPNDDSYLSNIIKSLNKNCWINFKSGNRQIILGKGIADKLNIKDGDWVSIMIPVVNINKYKISQFKNITLYVTGIFHINSQIDNIFAIVPLDDASQYLNMEDSITGIAIKIKKLFDADNVIRSAGKMTNNYVYIKNWIDKYGYIYHDIQMIRSIIYIAMIFVILIACFNIISNTIIIVKDKSNDIAILNTMGATKRLIHHIFICYSTILSFIGIILGILISILFSLKLETIVNLFEKFTGYHLIIKNAYFVDFLPSKIYWQDIVYVVLISLIFNFLTSYYYIRKIISNNLPVKVLKK